MVTNNEMKARVFGVGMINPNNRYKKIAVTDIPIMITHDGKLLCIPNTREIKHIGMTSMTGTCKSLCLNALLSWDYYIAGHSCINLNDFQKETFEWSLPTDSFLHVLKKINADPFPKPMIYVFPSTQTLQINNQDKRFPYLKITLPIEYVIKHIEEFYKLDKSKVYITNLLDDFVECDSMGAIKSVVEENISAKHELMKYKILNIFQSVFDYNIINVSVPDASAFLGYKDKEGEKNDYYNSSISTLIRAGLIPSIQTSDLRIHDYFASYISFIVESLYKNQYEDDYFKNKTLSLFVDEIDKLWAGHNGQLAKKSLNLIGTNGRTARIGLRWSTQHYENVPDEIRGNTKYLFISRKANAKEVAEIRRDFDIPKSMDKDILELKIDTEKGLFEMVGVTTEKFAIYNLSTGEKTYTSRPQKGYLIPSNSMHHIPNRIIPNGEVEENCIVPEMMKKQEITFRGRYEIVVNLGNPKGSLDLPVFKNPFLMVDLFAEKTVSPPDIKIIDDMEELKKLGFIICSIKAPGYWFSGQKVRLKLTRKDNPIGGSTTLKYIPSYHKCEADINNKIIRLCGRNAGRNGYGDWLNLDSEEPEKNSKRSIRPVQKRPPWYI